MNDSTLVVDRTPIAIAIVEHEGLFLIGQRAADAALPGMAEFPGGKVRIGEAPAEAAVRECLEETGLPIKVGSTYPTVEHDYPHGWLKLYFFRCTLADPSGETTPRAPFRWVSPAELAQLDFPPANRDVVRRLREEHGTEPAGE